MLTFRKRASFYALAFTLGLGGPATAVAKDELTFSLAPQKPFILATTCVANEPVATLIFVVRNVGQTDNSPTHATVSGDFSGSESVPSFPHGSLRFVQMPIVKGAISSAKIGGEHTVRVTLDDGTAYPITFTFPTGFCAVIAPATVSTPGAGRPQAPSSTAPPSAAPPVNPSTFNNVGAAGAEILGASKASHIPSSDALTPNAPTGLTAVLDPNDCYAHNDRDPGAHDRCDAAIKSGDLLLKWSWTHQSGPPTIGGFRVYAIGSGPFGVADGSKKKVFEYNHPSVTLADLTSHTDNQCYVVVAYNAPFESSGSAPYCATANSAAKTAILKPAFQRSSEQKAQTGSVFDSDSPAQTNIVVGFSYYAEQNLFGDKSIISLHRGGYAFDVTSLHLRRLLSAKLKLVLDHSDGLPNNTSCATKLGTGNEFWWKNTNWLEAQFLPNPLPKTGPIISTDVTSIVASWVGGSPNYGFILKNDDEDLHTFKNATCLPYFSSATLELTYYDS